MAPASLDARGSSVAGIASGRSSRVAYEARIEETLDALADHLEAHMAVDRLLAIARGG